jgi:hypothetical protein
MQTPQKHLWPAAMPHRLSGSLPHVKVTRFSNNAIAAQIGCQFEAVFSCCAWQPLGIPNER